MCNRYIIALLAATDVKIRSAYNDTRYKAIIKSIQEALREDRKDAEKTAADLKDATTRISVLESAKADLVEKEQAVQHTRSRRDSWGARLQCTRVARSRPRETLHSRSLKRSS